MSNAAIATDNVVVITASAQRAIDEAHALISNARLWAENLTDFEWPDDDIQCKAAEAELTRRRELVREMELSWFTNLAHVLTMSSAWDGPELRLTRDTEACLYFRHMKSGYEGGLIFHRDLRYSKPGEPLTVGKWSIHT